ncbi:hypothetical protein MPNT_140027 [Candidatus Methylacidithermus pantelleriae]|uniref:Uncharacterized protein n=1 Tax=Candidatus Methylacidithermus pantelleriae TaxID=2744239 RepID=A0A8J2BND0_9BACT|nr:hypothetical protein MPNT_140027 [Candidatus Methylacidithermus pantelleriae]
MVGHPFPLPETAARLRFRRLDGLARFVVTLAWEGETCSRAWAWGLSLLSLTLFWLCVLAYIHDLLQRASLGKRKAFRREWLALVGVVEERALGGSTCGGKALGKLTR